MNCLVNAVVPASQYTIAPSLQQGFLDKVTGLPLAFGKVYFFRDVDHLQPKNVYAISGPPDAPVFTALPNPLTLSSIGTFIDQTNNQDIIPYYLPFDADGNVDLYYIEVYNSAGVLQFTRDHFPTVNESGGNIITLTDNFIPNGQFLGHLNLPNSGQISNPTTPIAYGNWTFELDSDFTSTNFVTFTRFNSATNNPPSNPRYAATIRCTIPNAAETRKDLCNTITDVNFMQGQIGVIQFSAMSATTSPVGVDVIVRQNFGTGGTSTIETIIGNLSILPTAFIDYNIPFTMPSTIGQTLGAGDDDYLQIVLRPDTAATFTIQVTDVIFAAGTFTTLAYPVVSPEQDKSFWIPASFLTPAYDGSDNNLFVQLQTAVNHGNTELTFAYASATPVGAHFWYTGITPPAGFLLEDGSSYAVSSDPNNTVTAYANLFGISGYAYGTGQNGFRNASVSSTQMSATWNRDDVGQPAPDAGTSGFTITVNTPGTIGTYQVVYVTPLAGGAITPGSYYRLLVNTTGPQFIQLFWFTVDGNGTIPTGVPYNVSQQISVASTDTVAQVVTNLIANANGLFQVPQVEGYFIRGWSHGSGNDPDAAFRIGSGYAKSGNTGDNIGSFQATAVVNHAHNIILSGSAEAINTGTGPVTPQFTEFGSSTTGGVASPTAFSSESRPPNVYFNGIIKY
jgi:uncharacterized protein YaiE (UPF0345 family)